MDMKLREGLVLPGVPFYDVEGKVLWGATAMMLSELCAVAENINQSLMS